MFFRRRKRSDADTAPAGAAPERERKPISTQFLTGDAARDQHSVESLLDEVARISARVARVRGSAGLAELLTYIVDASVERTGAQRGLLVLAGSGESGTAAHEIRVARRQGGEPIEGEVRYSTSAVNRVLETGDPMKDQFDSAAEARGFGASVADLKLHSLMCVSLDAHSEADGARARHQGVLYVDSRATEREFTAEDLSYFTALSRQIAIALRTARLHVDSLERAKLEESLETARVVQSHLMPQLSSGDTGFDLFGWYRAAERTSGDFYDSFETSSGKRAVVVGDVTGHGPASALITSTAQAFLRATLKAVDDPCRALEMLNEDMLERTEPGLFLTLFLTLFLCLLDPDGPVEVFNIGHATPFVWRSADGSIEEIIGESPPLGVQDDLAFRAPAAVELAGGDLLIAFTDGLSDARPRDDPGAFFGEGGVQRIVREVAPTAGDAREVGKAIVDAVLDHAAGNSEDDLTLVVVRREVRAAVADAGQRAASVSGMSAST